MFHLYQSESFSKVPTQQHSIHKHHSPRNLMTQQSIQPQIPVPFIVSPNFPVHHPLKHHPSSPYQDPKETHNSPHLSQTLNRQIHPQSLNQTASQHQKPLSNKNKPSAAASEPNTPTAAAHAPRTASDASTPQRIWATPVRDMKGLLYGFVAAVDCMCIW